MERHPPVALRFILRAEDIYRVGLLTVRINIE